MLTKKATEQLQALHEKAKEEISRAQAEIDKRDAIIRAVNESLATEKGLPSHMITRCLVWILQSNKNLNYILTLTKLIY